MVMINGASNRDERRFEHPDRFDVHRKIGSLSNGVEPGSCRENLVVRILGFLVFLLTHVNSREQECRVYGRRHVCAGVAGPYRVSSL